MAGKKARTPAQQAALKKAQAASAAKRRKNAKGTTSADTQHGSGTGLSSAYTPTAKKRRAADAAAAQAPKAHTRQKARKANVTVKDAGPSGSKSKSGGRVTIQELSRRSTATPGKTQNPWYTKGMRAEENVSGEVLFKTGNSSKAYTAGKVARSTTDLNEAVKKGPLKGIKAKKGLKSSRTKTPKWKSWESRASRPWPGNPM